jgi:heme A synthase
MILQAVLAGLFISHEEPDARDSHELMANITFLAVAVQLALAFLVRAWSEFRLMYWAAALLVLVAAQTGLGYASEDNTFPEAVHIPLGVLIFGLALVISTLAVLEGRARGSTA